MSTYDTPETARYDNRRDIDVVERGGYRDLGAQIFLWMAWTLAFAFWALTMSSFIGILKALGSGAPGGIQGGADAGGAGFMLMDVVGGLVGLGLLIAWGMARSASRDKRLDASTEASTAALYDHIERRGGDDMIDRSPEARRPHERDSYRPA